jgi:hypothetical protein
MGKRRNGSVPQTNRKKIKIKLLAVQTLPLLDHARKEMEEMMIIPL